MSSTESSDSEGSLPDVAPINVYPVLPKVVKLESSKKKKMLSIGGFTFYFGYMTIVHIEEAPGQLNERNACVYHCSKLRTLGCKMMIWIDEHDNYIHHRGAHSHHANPVAIEKRKIMAKAKQLIRDDPVKMTPKKARVEALTGAHPGVVAVMKEQNMDRVLQLEKHRGFPVPKGRTGPKHLDIPDNLKLLDGQPFIFFDSGKGKNRVIGMGTSEMLTVLCNAEENADDGTFKIIKPEKHWSQVFAQHANIKTRFVPAVVWFLGKATTEVFTRVLKALDDWSIQNLGKPYRPKRILTDNEGAQRAAIRDFFGGVMHPVEHKTCWFHFVQALMKHLKDLALLDAYYNSVPFYLFIRKLCCLALIHPDFISTAFNYLEQEATSFLEEPWYHNVGPFLRYFESTWVQRRNCRGQIVEGRIPKQYWNHHHAATAGRATTTSSLEGWNRRTTEAAAKYPKMSIWYLLHHFKNEIGKESHQRIVRLSQGIGLVETSTAAQKRKIEGIKEALTVFNEEEMGTSMARMSNAIDGIELIELDFDGM